MGWQSIETSPKETPVLIWDGEMQCVAQFEIWFAGHAGSWNVVGACGNEYDNSFSIPTHWMPLPNPPESTK